jgi:hypothetical protein
MRSFTSAASQPKAETTRVIGSKSLAVAQHAIPLFPFADETKSREHVIFLVTHCTSCDLAEYGCAAAGDNASPTPNPKDGKCLNFQRKSERQLKLSKLSTLKGLKLSKMSSHLKSLLLAQGRALVVIGRCASLRTIIRTSVVSISKESPKSNER